MEFTVDSKLSTELNQIISSVQMPGTEISCTIIDMSGFQPMLFGYNMQKFQYPASVVKIFVAAEVLRQIEAGFLALEQVVEISPNNVVGDPRNIFSVKGNHSLENQTTASIDTLLEAMLSDNSNTASNVLIDLVTRKKINGNIVQRFNWDGSELTRKFLSRYKEDLRHKNARWPNLVRNT